MRLPYTAAIKTPSENQARTTGRKTAAQSVVWIETEDGSPTLHNLDIDETYHSTSGAWAESQHVFLEPWLRLCPGAQTSPWRVLDIGFGLGLNWLTFVNALVQSGKAGEIISLEKNEKLLSLKHRPFTQWLTQTLSADMVKLHGLIRKDRELQSGALTARLLVGEAGLLLEQLAEQKLQFDVILQDPFSPAKNPECWDAGHFARVARLCAPGAALLTYSVARVVRETLAAAGFRVQKLPGYGEKREQLLAIYEG